MLQNISDELGGLFLNTVPVQTYIFNLGCVVSWQVLVTTSLYFLSRMFVRSGWDRHPVDRHGLMNCVQEESSGI